MINYYLLLIFFILINLILVINFSKVKIFHLNVDVPDKKRKFHLEPTPLAGGQIIYLNILIYWFFFNFGGNLLVNDLIFENTKSFNFFMIIATLIFLIGFIDDKVNLKANIKFTFLFLTILILLLIDKNLVINNVKFSFYNKNFFLEEYGIFFSVFCFLVFINAFNMFDGINLQSALYSLLIFTCVLFLYSNSFFIKILIICMIGFTYLNFKNKSFLGDSGSLLLSFIISYLFIKLYNSEIVSFSDEVTLYMLIPGLDLIRLFIIRIINKKNPLSSDRMHLHHLLIEKYSFKKTICIIVLLILLPLVLSSTNIGNILSIFITIFVYIVLLVNISKKFKISH